MTSYHSVRVVVDERAVRRAGRRHGPRRAQGRRRRSGVGAAHRQRAGRGRGALLRHRRQPRPARARPGGSGGLDGESRRAGHAGRRHHARPVRRDPHAGRGRGRGPAHHGGLRPVHGQRARRPSPRRMRSTAPQRVTITVRLRSDNGLSTVTWDDVTLAYPTVRPVDAVDPAQLDVPAAAGRRRSRPRRPGCCTSTPPSPAEATCPPRRHARGPAVPMLMAGSIASDEEAQVTVDSQRRVPGRRHGRPHHRRHGHADHGQRLPASSSMKPGARPGPFRPTGRPAPVSYLQTVGRRARCRSRSPPSLADAWNGAYLWAGAPAEAGALDVPFRSLTEHVAASGRRHGAGGRRLRPGQGRGRRRHPVAVPARAADRRGPAVQAAARRTAARGRRRPGRLPGLGRLARRAAGRHRRVHPRLRGSRTGPLRSA